MIILLIIVICVVVYRVYQNEVEKKYERFIREHSIAIKKLDEINKNYDFHDIPSFDMENRYDNENYYDTISTKDYLTYQLVYIRKEVMRAISDTAENKRLYAVYRDVIKAGCPICQYDTTNPPKNEDKLRKIEKKLFLSMMKNPRIEFDISVRLVNTNINGVRLTSKSDSFGVEAIEDIINRLGHKNGDFYLDNDIWQSICRVERGKVTNKMRFAIYERDGHRCRKCGRHSEYLEIDHIYPISKGGKSTYDNLQTLCHDCNAKKSNTIEAGVINPRARQRQTKEICPYCGANLIIKDGRYGDFYACPNYPKCKFTKQIK